MAPSSAQHSCRFVALENKLSLSHQHHLWSPWEKGTHTSGICSASMFHGSLRLQQWHCSTSGVLQQNDQLFPHTEGIPHTCSSWPSMLGRIHPLLWCIWLQPVTLQSESAKIPPWSRAQCSLCCCQGPSLTQRKASPPSQSLRAFMSPFWTHFPYIGSTGVANMFHNSFLVMVAQRRV